MTHSVTLFFPMRTNKVVYTQGFKPAVLWFYTHHRDTNSCFPLRLHIFSNSQNSSQVHHDSSPAAHFRGFVFFCMTLQVDVVVPPPPTYSVTWTITFWLSSLIPQAHAPIVCFIPVALSSRHIWHFLNRWPPRLVEFHLVGLSRGLNHAPCSWGIKRQGRGECCLLNDWPSGWRGNFHWDVFSRYALHATVMWWWHQQGLYRGDDNVQYLNFDKINKWLDWYTWLVSYSLNILFTQIHVYLNVVLRAQVRSWMISLTSRPSESPRHCSWGQLTWWTTSSACATSCPCSSVSVSTQPVNSKMF